MKRYKAPNPGDRVAYAASWLRNIGHFSGHIPFRRGTFLGVEKTAPESHGRVKWDDIEELIAECAKDPNSQYADAEYVAEIRANGQLVALSAIAKVGSPRFALNDL